MLPLYLWIMAHPTTVSLAAYHLASWIVGSLEMPDASSGKLYRFFFRFANSVAANYTRAGSVPKW